MHSVIFDLAQLTHTMHKTKPDTPQCRPTQTHTLPQVDSEKSRLHCNLMCIEYVVSPLLYSQLSRKRWGEYVFRRVSCFIHGFGFFLAIAGEGTWIVDCFVCCATTSSVPSTPAGVEKKCVSAYYTIIDVIF